MQKVSDFAQRTVNDVADKTINRVVEDKVNDKVAEATKAAEISAGLAAQKAEQAANEAEKAAKKAVQSAVKDKMTEITQHTAETSVTVLGIFASIVLTVVTGIVYSSSALENIDTPNFCRLICVLSLVGLICFNLIAIMLRFVERFRDKSDVKNTYFSRTTVFISIVLVVFVIITGAYDIIKELDEDTNTELNTEVESEFDTEV